MGVSVWRTRGPGIAVCLVLLLAGCRPSIGLAPAPTPTSEPSAEPVLEITVTPEVPTAIPEPPTPTPVPVPQPVSVECTVIARSLRLRSGPSTDTAVVAGLANGQVLRASARNPEATWVAVQTPEGLSGWVSAEFVSCAQPMDTLPVGP